MTLKHSCCRCGRALEERVRTYVSSLALGTLALTAPSSVTQDRSTARQQTMEIKDVKGQHRMQRHACSLQEPLTFLTINVSQIVQPDDEKKKKEPSASRFNLGYMSVSTL